MRHSKTIYSLRGIVILLLLGMGAAHAEPTLAVKTRYYSVLGYNKEGILNSMIGNAPSIAYIDRIERHAAQTIWSIRMNVRSGMLANECMIQKVGVHLNIEYVFPKLENARLVSRKLHQSWKRYMAALFLHEQGHKKIAEQASVELEKQLKLLTPSSNCALLKSKARRVYNKVLDKCKVLQKAFDVETGNGKTLKVFMQ